VNVNGGKGTDARKDMDEKCTAFAYFDKVHNFTIF